MLQVFADCAAYAPEGCTVQTSGEELLEVFERAWLAAGIVDRWGDLEDAIKVLTDAFACGGWGHHHTPGCSGPPSSLVARRVIAFYGLRANRVASLCDQICFTSLFLCDINY